MELVLQGSSCPCTVSQGLLPALTLAVAGWDEGMESSPHHSAAPGKALLLHGAGDHSSLQTHPYHQGSSHGSSHQAPAGQR